MTVASPSDDESLFVPFSSSAFCLSFLSYIISRVPNTKSKGMVIMAIRYPSQILYKRNASQFSPFTVKLLESIR